MMKLKMEHGDEAIPISHKFVKEEGLFNSRLFAREVVELTAAIQERRFKSSLAGGKKKIDSTIGDSDKLRPDPSPAPMSEGIGRPAVYAAPASAVGEGRTKAAGFAPAGRHSSLDPAGSGAARAGHEPVPPAPATATIEPSRPESGDGS